MRPDPLSREQAQSLADGILALDGVADLDGGRFGEVAMLFPGARVKGLHIATSSDDPEKQRCEVNIVAKGEDLPNLDELAESVRRVAAHYTDLPVDVTVSDIA